MAFVKNKRNVKRMDREMTCKEIEMKIPDFVNRKLEYKDLIRFLEHIETCENCKEELTIQFLITEGMARLEDGSAFDLQKELNLRMEECRRKIRRYRYMQCISITMEIVAVLAIGVIVYLIFF